MSPELNVTVVDQVGGQAVIRASGEIDMDSTGELERMFGELVAQGARRLVVDISEVDFCDSTGLATFVRARDLVREYPDGAVALVGMGSAVRKVFGITGLTELFECYDTVAAAQAGRPAQDRATE